MHQPTHLVITSAEDEVGIGVLVENTLDDLALVDGQRTNLEVLLTNEDLDGPTRSKIALEQVEGLLALKLSVVVSAATSCQVDSPKVRVRVTVVPSNGRLLDLDRTTRCALSVVAEDLLDFTHPAHVKSFGHVGPFALSGSADETAVLGGHANVGDHTPVLFQEVSVTTRDKEDDVVGVCGEGGDGRARTVGRDGMRWDLDDRGKGSLQSQRSPLHKDNSHRSRRA